MARTNATNFSGALQFPYATAAADLFKKEDVQTLAVAVDQHDHTTGKGVAVNTTPANASITNAQLGPDVARANLLTDGGFEIWQRGLATVFTGSSHNADGWEASLAAGDTMSVQRDNAVVDTGSMNAAFVAYTKSSGGSQLIQAMNDRVYRGKTLSLSVRVYANAIGAVQAFIYDNVLGFRQGAVNVGPINTWETLTFTAPISPAATSSGVGLWFSNSVQVRVDNAMLVVGSQPADYAPLHPADDLARCTRYYELLNLSSGQYQSIGQAYASNTALWTWFFSTQKAITPTITLSSPGSWVALGATGSQFAASGMASTTASLKHAAGVITASGLVAGNASAIAAGGSGATIVSEANP